MNLQILVFVVVSAMGSAVGCAAPAATPEIDAYVRNFNEMNLNGFWGGVELPGDTPPLKVVKAFIDTQGKTADRDQYVGWKAAEIKQLDASRATLSRYTVVLVESAKGSKTMIFMSPSQGAWSVRPYFVTTVP